MIDDFAPATWIRFIPLLPLLAAGVHGLMVGLLRRSLAFRTAAAITLGSVVAALIFSGLAFAELIAQPGDGAIVDRVGTWIGAGVGPGALVVDHVLRFDPLSAVMCMLVTGVGLLALVYAIGELPDDTRDDRGEQRFFALACLQLAAMLWLVLADDAVLLGAAFTVVGFTTWWLLGFWYADPEQGRVASIGFVLGRVGDAALLGAVALMFQVQAEAGTTAPEPAGLAAVRPALQAAVVPWPEWLGGGAIPAPELVGLLLLVAIASRAGQLPFSGWLGESVGAPTAALVIVHTITTVAAPVYLGARFAWLFADAPGAASAAAWLGAGTALACALVACAQVDALRVLAWSTASQMGYALAALGAAAPTAAVFHVVAHAFGKGLILMTMGVVIAALGRERNLWRMGNLGSRLWRTRVDTWIAVLSIGGVLPVSIGFFSLEQVVVAAGTAGAVAGHAAMTWTLLLAVSATGFYVVRLIYLSLYGETRIPAHVRWEELEDPRPVILWPMGILAALTISGALIGMPQNWADLLFTDVADANSLHHFLAPALGVAATPVPAAVDAWTYAGRAMGMALLGALPAVWLYLYRPGWLTLLSDRLAWPRRALLHGLWLEPALRRLVASPVVTVADRVLDRGIEGPLIEGASLRGSARLLHGVANGWLRRLQSGSASLYVAVVTVASLLVVVYLVLERAG